MAGKINMVTGETYTLAELFSDERRIIIPDLQRDYCWGDENNIKSTGDKGELVTGFVTNMLDRFSEYSPMRDDSLNMGLLYGYEIPADHIQLCDGQQRLTTLFLLLGMLNKMCGCFQRYLISDFEYKYDDKEPYLNYAIRESSLYFLSDLVSKFFIGDSLRVADVKSADWYFSDYDLDPSIQSVLNALKKIEKIIDEKNVDCKRFGEWLLNKISFLYFDMQSRKNGEETFVVINTTGEPLSSAQNLKPLVIKENKANTVVPKQWEEIETWFWRKAQKVKINDTADAGFAEFLRWITIIEESDQQVPEELKTDDIKFLIQPILQGKEYDFPYKKISFAKIYDYWKAACWIEGTPEIPFPEEFFSPRVNGEVNNRNAIKQSDCFVLLPVLKFVVANIKTIGQDVVQQRNARRIYEFFNNLIRIGNVAKAVNTLVGEAIRVVDLIENGDVVSLADKQNVSRQLLTEEEIRKLKILRAATNRIQIEEAFWSAQEHKIWSGEILPMIEWATDDEGKFDIDSFNDYRQKFAEVFFGACDGNIDGARRAFLTLSLKGYPIDKGSNLSFGWDWDDWQRIIGNNKGKFKCFFDSFAVGESKEWIKKSISEYEGSDAWAEFIKRPKLMAYCGKKNVQRWGDSWILIKSVRATTYCEMRSYCLCLDYKDRPGEYEGWSISDEGVSPVCFRKAVGNLIIEIKISHAKSQMDDYVVGLLGTVEHKDDSSLDRRVPEMLAKPAAQILGQSIANQEGCFEVKGLSLHDVKQKVQGLLNFSYYVNDGAVQVPVEGIIRSNG